MNRSKRKRDASRPPSGRDGSEPIPAAVAQMLERYPRQSPRQMAIRVAVALLVAALGLWGVLASDWSVAALLAFFGIELLIVFLFNWVAITVLPTQLDSNDRNTVKGWLWLAGMVVAGLVAYVAIEGPAGAAQLREAMLFRAQSARAFMTTHGLWIAGGGLLLVHATGFGFDVAWWRSRGGNFTYWSGVSFAARLWFVLAFGFFAYMLGGFLGMNDSRTGALILLWALFLGADLFAMWLPWALHRKAASGFARK